MNPFHTHLDECGHCACNPSDLCPVGMDLQAMVAAECRPQLLLIETPKVVRPINYTSIVTQTIGYDHHKGDKKGTIVQREAIALSQ